MQLRTLKISNIGSFPFVSDIHSVSGIQFHTSETGVTNILIGPNGTGKSTILEVINQVFKAGLIRDYVYDKTYIEELRNTNTAFAGGDPEKLSRCITPHYRQVENMQKHVAYTQESSQAYMEILLNKNDYHNIRLILEHREKLNVLLHRYSPMQIEFPAIDEASLYIDNIISLHCTFDIPRRRIYLRNEKKTATQQFLFDYVRHHELIQICTHIFNKYEKSPHEADWEPLKSTFALLGANRQFEEQYTYKEYLTDKDVSEQIAHADTKHHIGGGLGYLLCRKKFRDSIRAANGKVEDIFTDPLYQKINELLKKYVGFSLHVQYNSDKVYLSCKNASGYIFSFNQLSSGEQSFVLLVLTVFGYDLRNGLMVIDEPELHLHPQTQKKIIELLTYLEKEMAMQFIIATHAPLMVTPQTVHHVLRCTKRNDHTHVINPHYMISNDEANLVHMLQYENTAKIFFVDKIIMVEGETDLYFFSFYCDFLSQQEERRGRIDNYEIIDIGGKGSFEKWQKMLYKFGITTFYIGDRDNVLEQKYIDLTPYKNLLHAQAGDSSYRIQRKTQKYAKLIQLMRDVNPQEYEELQAEVQKLITKNVLLLPQGDLETYLGLEKKGLAPTVAFCREKFTKRRHDPAFADRRNELYMMMKKIFA